MFKTRKLIQLIGLALVLLAILFGLWRRQPAGAHAKKNDIPLDNRAQLEGNSDSGVTRPSRRHRGKTEAEGKTAFDLDRDRALFSASIISENPKEIEDYLRDAYRIAKNGTIDSQQLDHVLVQVGSSFAALSDLQWVDSSVVRQWESLLLEFSEDKLLGYSTRGRAVLALSSLDKVEHRESAADLARQLKFDLPGADLFCQRCIIAAGSNLQATDLIKIARNAKSDGVSSVVTSVIGRDHNMDSIYALLAARKEDVLMRSVMRELTSPAPIPERASSNAPPKKNSYQSIAQR